MKYRLVAHAPLGDRLGVLPAPLSWSASIPHNEVSGAAELKYSRAALRGELLDRRLADGLEVAVEAHDAQGWHELDGGRFLTLKRAGDRADATDTVSLTCPGFGWLLTKIRSLNEDALLGEESGSEVAGKRPFLSATAGVIVGTLLGEYQARGGPAIARSWDSTHDSTGAPWSKVLTVHYEHGIQLDVVLANLVAQGVVDLTWRGREMVLTNPDSTTRDLSGSVVLRDRRDVAAAPWEETIEELVQVMALQGGGDLGTVVETSAEAPAPWGRWEGFDSNGSITDPGTAAVFLQSELQRTGRLRGQYMRDLLSTSEHVAGLSVLPGDWVSAPTNVPTERVRVAGVMVRAEGDAVTTTLTLNDRLLDAELRRARRQRGIVGGSGAGSTIRPAPEGPDKRQPAAPEGLVISTAAYIDQHGFARAQVTAQWAPVSTARPEDGGGLLEVAQYELWGRENKAGAPWKRRETVSGTTASTSDLDVATSYQWRVRALGKYATAPGVFSIIVTRTTAHDVTPPPVPSAPQLSTHLGVITAFWDGLGAQGEGMPVDFRFLEVAMSTTSVTNPPAAAVIDRIYGGKGSIPVTGQPYDALRYFRFRGVDGSGNRSGWSAQASIAAKALVDADLIGTTIEQAFAAANARVDDLRDNVIPGVSSEAQQAATDAATALANAQTAYDQALAAAAQGPSLVTNGDFELGDQSWNVQPESKTASSTGARSGSRLMRLDVATANRWPTSSPWRPAEQGRWFLLTAWFRLGHDSTGTPAQVGFVHQYQTASGGTGTLVAADATSPLNGSTWVKVQHLVQATTAGTVRARFAPWAQAFAGGVVHVDDMSVVDVTESHEALVAAQQAATAAAAAAQAAADAADAAGEARSIALGADKRIRGGVGAPTPADGAGAPVGAIWWEYAGDPQTLVRMWVWSGSAWQVRPLDRSLLPLVDIGSGTFGDLDGIRLKARSVVADALAIGGASNMVPDPGFASAPLRQAREALYGARFIDAPDQPGASYAYRLPTGTGGTVNGGFGPGEWEVTPGDEILLAAFVRGHSTIRWRFTMNIRHAHGGVTYTAVSGWRSCSSESRLEEAVWTVPTTAVGATLRVQRSTPGQNGDTSQPGDWVQFELPVMRPRVGSILLEDGAVTTPKLFVDEAMVNRLKGKFAEFDSGVFNWIKAGDIESGAIRAQHLALGMVEGLEITPSSIHGEDADGQPWLHLARGEPTLVVADVLRTGRVGGPHLRLQNTVADTGYPGLDFIRGTELTAGGTARILLRPLGSGGGELSLQSSENPSTPGLFHNVRIERGLEIWSNANQEYAFRVGDLGQGLPRWNARMDNRGQWDWDMGVGGAVKHIVPSSGTVGFYQPGGGTVIYGSDFLSSDGWYYLKSDVAYARTTTSAANLHVNGAGRILRSTSLRAAKLDIDYDQVPALAAAAKQLRPVTFLDRGAAERGEPTPRVLGFIAEDVDEIPGARDLGLVATNLAGDLDGLPYDRLAAALAAWLGEHETRLKHLEAR